MKPLSHVEVTAALENLKERRLITELGKDGNPHLEDRVRTFKLDLLDGLTEEQRGEAARILERELARRIAEGRE